MYLDNNNINLSEKVRIWIVFFFIVLKKALYNTETKVRWCSMAKLIIIIAICAI